MDVLKLYRYVTNYALDEEPYAPYAPPQGKQKNYVVPEAISVTVANIDSRSQDFVTAHDLKDYRRVSFNLVILPKIELAYDIVAKGVYDLGEYL